MTADRVQALADSHQAGRVAGHMHQTHGVPPVPPASISDGSLLMRKCATQWYAGLAEGRGEAARAVQPSLGELISRTGTAPALPGLAEVVSRLDTAPAATERLHEYWVHGEGAAKIRWGQPGDFSRCVLHLGKYIKDPQGYCNLAHHAALGIYPATHAAMDKKATGRSAVSDTLQETAAPSRAEYMRLYALEDIHILRSADGGDGRTVEAYAAVFDEPAEIQDQEGHYVEVIDPAAFNRAIDHASRARGGFPGSVKVLWNHGRDLSGTPSDRFSMPIGVPVDIRAETRGLLTRTRYSETPLADEVLENIRAGSITSQSFTGAIMRSDPQLRRGDRYRAGASGDLRTVRRTELGLREYGPVLWPAYSGAEIMGVRMSTPGSWSPDPGEEFDPALPPDGEPATGDPLTPDGKHSARHHQHALYALRSQELREQYGLVW